MGADTCAQSRDLFRQSGIGEEKALGEQQCTQGRLRCRSIRVPSPKVNSMLPPPQSVTSLRPSPRCRDAEAIQLSRASSSGERTCTCQPNLERTAPMKSRELLASRRVWAPTQRTCCTPSRRQIRSISSNVRNPRSKAAGPMLPLTARSAPSLQLRLKSATSSGSPLSIRAIAHLKELVPRSITAFKVKSLCQIAGYAPAWDQRSGSASEAGSL